MSNNRRHMRHIRTSMLQYVQTSTSEIPSGSVIASVNQVPTPAELENITNPSEFILCGGAYYRLTGKQPSANESLNYGEIAVAYRDGHERLFIKNSDNEIVEFIPWKYSDMPTRLSTLTDVTIDNATLASGQVLSYDGNGWTNSDADISIAEDITYASLYSKLNLDQLEPNKLYRITDYVTITKNDASAASDITYKSARHAFDLVVLAVSDNSLDCKALAVQHSGDSYFNNSLMYKWEVWYDIENDTALYDWADESNGKGVIYRMIDEYGNDCPYDFKNFQFKRKLDSNGELDKNGTQYWLYTFSLYSSSAITDSTLGQVNHVYDNTMKPNRGNYLIPNDNVFIGQYIRHNKMSYSCSSNTLHWTCQDNEFGMHCSNIVLYGRCASNIFGQHCERIELLSDGARNTFGEYCTNIYLGSTSQRNTFGNNVTSVQSDNPISGNTIGNYSSGIVFLYGGSGNMVGDSTYNVEFGNQARENKIGDNCSEITIGDYCENNTIGDNCLEVMVGDRAAMNNIHDNCSYIRFKNSDGTANTTYTRFIEVDGGNQLINLYAANGSASSYLQNIYIAQGANNSNNWLTIDSIARSLPYRTTVGRMTPDSGMSIGTLRIYNEDDPAAASLSGLTDVTIGTLADGQALVYDSATSKWINGDINVGLAESITYSNLVSLISANSGAGNLVPGKLYRITDYVTTTVQTDTQSANHPFDLVVMATSPNTLDCRAKAVLHSGDTYFSASGNTCDLSKWQIWYDINNDTVKYAWADSTNGKGVIYRMVDDYGNDCPYDFKNIQFKRELDSNGEYDPTNGTLQWVYTFSYYSSPNITDASLSSSNSVKSNLMKPYYAAYAPTRASGGQTKSCLNDNVFLGNGCQGNILENGCTGNTFGSSFIGNVFGNNCSGNVFGNTCYGNILGNFCDSNTFGSNCRSNILGNVCPNNIFDDNCSGNTLGNSCEGNNFGGGFDSNAIGNNCHNNTFGTYCLNNTLKNDCDFNTFGSSCSYNSIGNGCSHNSFGYSFYGNTLGDECSSNIVGGDCMNSVFSQGCNNNTIGTVCTAITLGNECHYISIGSGSVDYISDVVVGDGCRYIKLYNSDNPTQGNVLHRIYIASGVEGTPPDNYLVFSTITRERPYRTTIGKESNGTLRFYNEHDYPYGERLKVGTYSEYNISRQVVTHEGHGTTGEGYGTDTFTFRISSSTDSSNHIRHDLRVGHFATESPTSSTDNVGRITLACGRPTSVTSGVSAYAALEAPNSTIQTVNSLPILSGELVSSGGLASDASVSVINGVSTNTTYYQCLYRAGRVYAPALGSGGGGGSKLRNDYPEDAEWNNGTVNGPTLVLSSVTTQFPTLVSDPIPSASTTQSGVVTTGLQTFAGGKTFHDGLVTDAGITFVGNSQVKYQASQGSSTVIAQLPGISGTFGVFGSNQATPDYLVGKTSNGYMTSNIAIGTDTTKFLRNDGTWAVPAGGGGGGGDNYYPESASWNNGTTAGPTLVLSATNNNFPQITSSAIPTASSSQSGIVTTDTQVFMGTKTFSQQCVMNNGVRLPRNEAITYRSASNTKYTISLPSASSGTMAVIGTIGTATNMFYYDSNAGCLVQGPALGTDTTKFLRNDGTWAVPAGGGGGGSTVAFTIGSGYSKKIGLNLGELSIDGLGYAINVRPARADIDNGTSINTRQGVMKPLFESFNSVMGLHGTNFRNTLQIDNCIACTNFVLENGSVSNFIAIPVVVDYYINQDTGALESIPYILLPKDMFSGFEISDRFVIGTINPITDQVDPDRMP